MKNNSLGFCFGIFFFSKNSNSEIIFIFLSAHFFFSDGMSVGSGKCTKKDPLKRILE